MEKNRAGQWVVFAYGLPDNANPGEPVTGDAANISANLSRDGGAAIPLTDTAPVELEKGYYVFDITAAEADGDLLSIYPSSTTADVQVIGVPGAVWTRPPNFNELDITPTTGRVDLGAVDGDTTAPGNLALMYNGVGYTDPTAPSSRAQVSQLSVGTGGISTVASDFVPSGAEGETGSFTDTFQEDGTYHIVTPDGGTTDVYYEFNVGVDGVPQQVEWWGYAQGNNNTYNVFFYNFELSAYEQVGTIAGANGTSQMVDQWTATVGHVGVGINAGQVRLRFQSTDGSTIATDRIICTYTVRAAGIENGSTITLVGAATNRNLIGRNWNLDLNGQDISGAYVHGAISVVGTSTGTAPVTFEDCIIQTATLPPGTYVRCGLAGTVTLAASGDYFIYDCYSSVAGASTPTINYSSLGGGTTVNIRNLSGGLQGINIAPTTESSWDFLNGGNVSINGTGGTVFVRGRPTQIVDNSGGSVTVDMSGVVNQTTINEQVDIALSDIGLDHLVAAPVSGADVANDSVMAQIASASPTADWDTFDNAAASLEAIRNRGDAAWTTGAGGSPPHLMQATTIATLATQTQFTLTAGSVDDDAYNDCIVVVTDSVTAVQKMHATVLNYVGATRTMTLTIDKGVFTIAPGDSIDIMSPLGSSTGGGGGDPWLTELPGGYTGSQAGAIVGNNLDEQVSTRMPTSHINATGGKVNGVALVDETTLNADMRGTDGANTTTPATPGDAMALVANAVNAASIATNAIDADALAPDAVAEIATAVLTTVMTESYAADGATNTLAQAVYMLLALNGQKDVAGTTVTVRRLNGSTTAATYTLDDDTNPTSITRTS